MPSTPRLITINASNEAPTQADIQVRRAETLRVSLTPSATPMHLTVSMTPGGSPIVEIPSEAAGSLFIITPAKVSSLQEGKKYRMNIWNSENQQEPLLLVDGTFITLNTIEPSFVQYATQYFEWGTVVTLTPEQYADLPSLESGVIYAVKED